MQSSKAKDIFAELDFCTELNEEDQESVVGGFSLHSVINGVKDAAGASARYVGGGLDGLTGSSRERNDLPYRVGYRVGQVDKVGLEVAGVAAGVVAAAASFGAN